MPDGTFVNEDDPVPPLIPGLDLADNILFRKTYDFWPELPARSCLRVENVQSRETCMKDYTDE